MNATPAVAPISSAPAVPALTRALYSPKETEALLSVSHATLYRLIAAGKLDARKIGEKTVILRESIEKLIGDLPPAVVRPTV